MLIDNHNRKINYVRLAVTDRCNLRCFYCMPEEGINYVKRNELLSYEEMERLIKVLASEGIFKVRITGGEPFLRKGMFEFIESLNHIEGITELHITTNGTLTKGKVQHFRDIGIKSVNLSLDTLNKERFFQITRRDEYVTVMATLYELLDSGIDTKINCVVMQGQNIDDILPLVALTEAHPISVRFIEEMPFNGSGDHPATLFWTSDQTIKYIKDSYPNLGKIPDSPHSTSMNYHIPGYQGTVGFIAAYSRLFCGSCNRIRVTPQGMLKTCLYDSGVFSIKELLRHGASDEELKVAIQSAISHRAKDGFEAERNRGMNNAVSESMATIGG